MEILEKYEFGGRRGREKTYDYDTLLDGKIRRLVKGTDFTAKPESVKTTLATEAKKRGLKFHGQIEGDSALVVVAEKDLAPT